MSRQKTTSVFSRSRHLTHDELIRYCHHVMSGSEQHELEKHIVDCELCSEALKGVSEMENAALLYQISHDLHRRADRKGLLRRSIFSQQELIAIIAVVFLILFLLLMVFFFFTGKKATGPVQEKNKTEQMK